MLPCTAREEEEARGTRIKIREKADVQLYGEKWPSLPPKAMWMLHLYLPALAFQVLAPKKARKDYWTKRGPTMSITAVSGPQLS